MLIPQSGRGINTGFAQGALMIIDDHINMLGSNPLVGMNDDRFGTRFPDMSEVYSTRLRRIADDAARAKGVPVSHGTYIAVHGPSYETPAEIRFFRSIGADAAACRRVRKRSRPPRGSKCGIRASELRRVCSRSARARGGHWKPRDARGSFIALLEGIIERLYHRRRAHRPPDAHAEFSHFKVAPRGDPDGTIIAGCNIENRRCMTSATSAWRCSRPVRRPSRSADRGFRRDGGTTPRAAHAQDPLAGSPGHGVISKLSRNRTSSPSQC